MQHHVWHGVVIGAVFSAAFLNCCLHGSPVLETVFLGSVSVVGLVMAYVAARELVSKNVFGYCAALAWVYLIFGGLCVQMHTDVPASQLTCSMMFVFYCVGCVSQLVFRMCTYHVLPLPVTLLLSEMQTLALWALAAKTQEPYTQFILAHIVVMLGPAVLFKCSQPHNQQQVSAAQTAGPVWASKSSSTAAGSSSTPSDIVHPTVTKGLSTDINWAALAKAKYQLRRGNKRHVKVCMKIATHLHADDLAPDALYTLCNSVAVALSESTRTSVRVADCAVRNGCVLITMAAYQQADDGGSNATGLPSAAAQALSFAQQFLPSLLQQLRMRDDASGRSSGTMLGPGQYLQLQLGDCCVRATMHQETQEWAFELVPPSKGGSDDDGSGTGSAIPQICFACPSLPSVGGMPVAPSMQPTSKRFRDSHQVAFSVRVRFGQRKAGHPTMVVGTCPDDVHVPSNTHSDDSSTQKASFQLWVRCQGQYVETVVDGLVLIDGSDATVRAAAHVPSSLLARHHLPDGPLARLQVLTAELWSGDVLLSSTPLLLDAMHHLQPAPAVGQAWFGWWGAPCISTAAGLVQELAQLTTQLQDVASYDEVVMESHTEFMADLVTWLSTMQHTAPGMCCDPCMTPSTPLCSHAPSSANAPVPSPSSTALHLCNTISSDLHAYAITCGLLNLRAFVCAQDKRVRLAAWHNASGSPGLPGLTFVQQAAAAMSFTRLCPTCDTVYYTRLRAHLRQTQIYISMPFAIAISCVMLMGMMDGLPTAICCLWGVFHLLSVLQLSSSNEPRMSDVFAFQLGAWISQLVVETAVGLGLFGFKGDLVQLAAFGPWLATHSVFSVVTEQASTWGRLPVWLVRSLVLIEAMAHACEFAYVLPHLPDWVAMGVTVGTLLIPHLLDKYWRKLLMGRRAGVAHCSRGM